MRNQLIRYAAATLGALTAVAATATVPATVTTANPPHSVSTATTPQPTQAPAAQNASWLPRESDDARFDANARSGVNAQLGANAPLAAAAAASGRPVPADARSSTATPRPGRRGTTARRDRGSLTADPARLLPATVSAARPARIVTTTVDAHGRPSASVRTAISRPAAADLIRAAQATADATSVELDVPVTTTEANTPIAARPRNAAFTAAELGSPATAARFPDPLRGGQWDLDRIGLPAAWARSTGAGVTVAVIDSGAEASHPDLAGQVLPGADLIAGTQGAGVDPYGHGTHVAGIVAALAGNGAGIAGVAPDVRILPVRVLTAAGTGYMSDAANGVVYAADHGADVINLSISAGTQVAAMTDAIAYARGKGAVVVAAAGNTRGSGSPVSFPAADPGVLAVAATDAADQIAPFSNQGGYVDLAAPGTFIVSTFPGGDYRQMSGTSMAAPHVAAAAALLRSADRTLTPDQIDQALTTTTTDLGVPGRDDDFGTGRLDLLAALATVVTPPTAGTEAAAGNGTAGGDGTGTESGNGSAPPVDPVVVSDATDRLINYGESTATAFTVLSAGRPWAQRPVDACMITGTAAPVCSTVTTAADGTLTLTRTAAGSFQIRVSVGGAERTVSYRVRATATVAPAGSGVLEVRIGGATGQAVRLQRDTGTGWSSVLAFAAAERVTIDGLDPGARYRVVVAATPTLVGTISDPAQL